MRTVRAGVVSPRFGGSRIFGGIFVGFAARVSGGWRMILMAMLPITGPWASLSSADQAPRLPNVVLILADDLGWTGLGCQGSDLYETPRIDGLARQGVRFTRAYAMSVCSPTRSMLMTGRHAARLGITIWSEGSLGVSPAGRWSRRNRDTTCRWKR